MPGRGDATRQVMPAGEVMADEPAISAGSARTFHQNIGMQTGDVAESPT